MRIAYRNKQIQFRQGFFEADETTPIEPYDSNYPAYAIYDTHGAEIESGIATPDPAPGYYYVDFTPDTSAELSTNVLHWRIEWLFVSNDNRQLSYSEKFDVEDEFTDEAQSRALSILGLSGRALDIDIKVPRQLTDVRVDLYSGTTEGSAVFSATKSNGKVVERQIDGMYAYVATVPAGTCTSGAVGTYMAVWEITDPASTTKQYMVSTVKVVSLKIMSWLAPLRLLIDKVQKKVNFVQSYEDADLVTFFEQGVGYFNGWYPLTSYTLSDIPQSLEPFLVICAAYWGLMAQFGLETDLTHSFSGQTITLEYDRTGNISDQLGRFKEWLTEHLSKAKIAIGRRQFVGVLATDIPRTQWKVKAAGGRGVTPDYTMNSVVSSIWYAL